MRRIALFLTLTLCAATVEAAPPSPRAASSKTAAVPDDHATPETIAEAKRHFQQAVALYNDGNYSAALAEFEAAYQTRPAAAVLYNIGLSQKALFRYPEAISSLRRYLDGSPRLTQEQRTRTEEIIAEMKALLADVKLEVTPEGAAVRIDERDYGKAPLTGLQLAAGSHTIEVSADGYEPARRELMVTAGVPSELRVELAAIPRTGKARITSSQPQSLVTIDGQSYGFAPVDVELPAGGHQLEVSAAKYETQRSELVLTAGQSRDIDVTLKKTEHLYQKWYLWAPIGLVAAGAAVGLGVGLTQTEGPIAGTLNPGAGKVN